MSKDNNDTTPAPVMENVGFDFVAEVLVPEGGIPTTEQMRECLRRWSLMTDEQLLILADTTEFGRGENDGRMGALGVLTPEAPACDTGEDPPNLPTDMGQCHDYIRALHAAMREAQKSRLIEVERYRTLKDAIDGAADAAHNLEAALETDGD